MKTYKSIKKLSFVTLLSLFFAKTVTPVFAQITVWGEVNPPNAIATYSGGLPSLISNVLRLLIVISGLYALFNFVVAGYGFMSAGGDPKKIADAWARIWQTLIGLLVTIGAFVLGAIFSRLLFGDYTTMLRLTVYGPN